VYNCVKRHTEMAVTGNMKITILTVAVPIVVAAVLAETSLGALYAMPHTEIDARGWVGLATTQEISIASAFAFAG